MVSASVATIITDVKRSIDENESASSILSGDIDQLQMDALIRSKIVDAVRYIHQTAPSSMLEGISPNPLPSPGPVPEPIPGHVHTAQDGACTVALPADFMRLVIFQMSDWKRPVITPISDTDPLYAMQGSDYVGIRGGVKKPVAVLTTNIAGKKILEAYSSEGSVAKLVYLPIPVISGVAPNETIAICTQLYQPVIYHCAGLVAMTYKDELAKDLFEIAKSYIS